MLLVAAVLMPGPLDGQLLKLTGDRYNITSQLLTNDTVTFIDFSLVLGEMDSYQNGLQLKYNSLIDLQIKRWFVLCLNYYFLYLGVLLLFC